jgi:octaprenyl-diphosphate synthase
MAAIEPVLSRKPAATKHEAKTNVLAELDGTATRTDLPQLGARLAALSQFLASDMAALETDLASIQRGGARVEQAAMHLLDLGGKRLRPICVMLASKLGRGFDPRAREVAVAVELVHNATLLHDDVVDLGEWRRGVLAARVVYGNATSVFAGDWLLIEALKRVERASLPGVFVRLLEVIHEMILAESIQLEARGTLDLDRNAWERVVEGKTAALFRWAMWAGGVAGHLTPDECAALESYGRHLGVAFQAVDDLLDLTGDPTETGKQLFADLAEGKMTWPVIAGLERDPQLRPAIEAAIAELGHGDDRHRRPILDRLEACGALRDCRLMAQVSARRAISELDRFAASPAKDALITCAHAAVERSK